MVHSSKFRTREAVQGSREVVVAQEVTELAERVRRVVREVPDEEDGFI